MGKSKSASVDRKTPQSRSDAKRKKAALRLIQRYYAIGKKIRDEHPNPRDPEELLKVKALMRKHRLPMGTAFKARAFAAKYNAKEFKALCALGRKWRLTWCHVRQFLSIPDDNDNNELRDLLQKQAADEEWSYRDLAAEIQARLGERKNKRGGPMIKTKGKREEPEVELRQFVIRTAPWLRYFEEVWGVFRLQDGSLAVSNALFLAAIDERSHQKFTSEFKKYLKKAFDRLTDLEDRVTTARTRIETAHLRVTNAMRRTPRRP